MKKNRIRLSESQLHRVIKESVKKVLKEADYIRPDDDDFFDYEDSVGDDREQYRTLTNYDKGFRVDRNKGIVPPARTSFDKYLERLPNEPSEGRKKWEMNQDFDSLRHDFPSVDDVFNGEKGVDNDRELRGQYFKKHFINNDWSRNDEKEQNTVSHDLWKTNNMRDKEKVAKWRQNQKDFSVADKRPLHRKGSLNRA